MYRRLFVLFSLLVLLILAGCGSPEATPVAQATPPHTHTAVPTETAVPPTATTTPTDTPAPTETATATETATPVPTATATAEPTDPPTPEPTETAVATKTPVPAPTNTPAPPAPVSLPASGSPPNGPNLVVNPGFENGNEGWNAGLNAPVNLQTASSFPNFVHSGSYSMVGFADQLVKNVQPGVNYRAGVWAKIWSSNGEDRQISDTPGDRKMKICVNTNGERNFNAATTICSGHFQPFDTWQYITVDFFPINDEVMIMLSGFISAPNNRPLHVEYYWDDVALGLSPVNAVATPTSPPPSRPVPPSPIAFDAQAIRSSMNNARSMIEQMGGLLDRLVRGSRETCDEYTGYYRGVVTSPRYDGVPAEWQTIYNEYIAAVELGSSTNQAIFETCFSGDGVVTELNYGAAREGINNSLNHLIPAIEAANALP